MFIGLSPNDLNDAVSLRQTVWVHRVTQHLATDTCGRRRFTPQIAIRTTALMALLALAPVAAMADGHQAAVLETRVAKVSLADVDLSTPEGRRVAYDRLRKTARRLCGQIEDMRSLAHQPAYVKCVDEALANALQQVKAPALAAVEKSRPER